MSLIEEAMNSNILAWIGEKAIMCQHLMLVTTETSKKLKNWDQGGYKKFHIVH